MSLSTATTSAACYLVRHEEKAAPPQCSAVSFHIAMQEVLCKHAPLLFTIVFFLIAVGFIVPLNYVHEWAIVAFSTIFILILYLTLAILRLVE